MYEIIFDEKAIEFLEKIEKNKKKRIYIKIISTKENPFHYFERLSGRSEYKMRVGDHRVIADIDEKTNTILILVIDHRKNIYKKM
ncbi:MAG: type II toxin-antitoxin system RelE/ParE family toxin [Thermoplasmata archaeon]|nr:type II toxin-antitoxin system RelE/ParE family toxin [Thermoplasmata archaeon]